MGLFGRKKSQKKIGICSVVVVAAGSSTRMGQDKILRELSGIPVIVHTLRAFEAVQEVAEIIVVTREDLIGPVGALCKDYRLEKVTKVVCGGSSRTESSRLGTLEARRDIPLIAIHDGARPFVTEELIRNVIHRGAETGAAAPAIPVNDTIKVASKGVVKETLDRSSLFAVQTPQVFEALLIRAALQSALDEHAQITDDCSAVERLGMNVSLTQGDERNIKLTTPTDLLWAESLLNEGMVR